MEFYPSSILSSVIPDRNVRILMLGCGNSSFSSDMYLDGYHNIVNTDISEICINKMAQLHKDKTMQWIVADALCLDNFQVWRFNCSLPQSCINRIQSPSKFRWCFGLTPSCYQNLKAKFSFVQIRGFLNYWPGDFEHMRRSFENKSCNPKPHGQEMK
jgi:hypothetical protein